MRVHNTIYQEEESVTAETEQAVVLNETVNGVVGSYLSKQRLLLLGGVGGGVAIVLLSLVGLTISLMSLVGVVLGGVVAGGGYYYVDQQEPELEINRFDKGYWTGYLYPTTGGLLLYDLSDGVDQAQFQVQKLEEPDVIREIREELVNTQEFPAVMANSAEFEERVATQVATAEETLQSQSSEQLDLPLFEADSQQTKTIATLIGRNTTSTITTQTAVHPERADDDLATIADLGNLTDKQPIEDDVETIDRRSRELYSELTDRQQSIVAVLQDHLDTAGDIIGLGGYNLYCPECGMEDVEAQLTIPDDPSEPLYCEHCRTEIDWTDAVPRHTLRDDVVLPVWDQLWEAVEEDREQIYADIQTEKDRLREAEREQLQEALDDTAKEVEQHRQQIRDLLTQAQAAKGTVDELGDLLVEYDRLDGQRKEEFTGQAERTLDQTQRQVEQTLSDVDLSRQTLLDELTAQVDRRSDLPQVEQRRRQIEFLPLTESVTTQSVAQQPPSTLIDQIQRQYDRQQEAIGTVNGGDQHE